MDSSSAETIVTHSIYTYSAVLTAHELVIAAIHSTGAESISSIGSRLENQRMWPSFISALVAAIGSLTVGYAMGYPSSALIDLSELHDAFAIEKGSKMSELFAVSGCMYMC